MTDKSRRSQKPTPSFPDKRTSMPNFIIMSIWETQPNWIIGDSELGSFPRLFRTDEVNCYRGSRAHAGSKRGTRRKMDEARFRDSGLESLGILIMIWPTGV